MSQKRLRLLAVTLVLLLGIAWLAGVFERNPSNIRVPHFELAADEVNSFTLALSADTLEFDRQAGIWYMRRPVSMLADSLTVSRFLSDLAEVTLNTRATSNPERYGIYGIDSTAATVTLQMTDESRQITFSQQGRDYSSIFVLLEEDPTVFSTNQRVTVTRDIGRWRDRRVMRTDPATMTSLRVFRPEGDYEVTRGQNSWLVDGAPADSMQVTNWLRRFDPLNADGFFDDLPPQVLGDAAYRIEITSRAGTNSLRGLPHESALALAAGGGQFTYRLFESRLDQLFPEAGTLLGE
ncbi:MAG: DUF4340 domain-containing protein [Bacteroidota bacterium]|nr:DUF4340 domain-containing protein [Bacteroidota bacterium]